MLPMRFFRSRAFSAGNAAIFFTFASLFGAVFFFAQMLQTALGYGPLDAGLRLIPWTITFITVAPLVGALADRFGERRFMVGGLTLQALGMGWIALISDPGLTYAEFVLPAVVAGVQGLNGRSGGPGSGCRLLRPRGCRQGRRRQQHDARAPRCLRGRSGGRDIRRGRQLRLTDAFLDAFAPAIAVVAALSLAGAIVALALPGRPQAAEPVSVGPVPALEVRGRKLTGDGSMTPRSCGRRWISNPRRIPIARAAIPPPSDPRRGAR